MKNKPSKKEISNLANKEIADTKKAIMSQSDFKSWLEGKFEDVLKYLLLDFVSLTFNYVDGGSQTKDGHVIFTVGANEKYHQMNVNVYTPAHKMWTDGKFKELVSGIVHECSHIHTDRITKVAEDRYVTHAQLRDANEYLTEVVAQYVRQIIKLKAPNIFNK